MENLILFVAVIITAIIVFVVLIEIFKNNGEKAEELKYHYNSKKFFMTRAEHECYDALLKAVGDKYYIFPQVHLPSVVDSKVVGQNWKGAFRHINQKSVDFVLCDKQYISPKLAIELDDKTHERQDRVERDGEVERILQSAGLPILRLKNQGSFDSNNLALQIDNLLRQI